jgi:hypothetical protein
MNLKLTSGLLASLSSALVLGAFVACSSSANVDPGPDSGPTPTEAGASNDGGAGDSSATPDGNTSPDGGADLDAATDAPDPKVFPAFHPEPYQSAHGDQSVVLESAVIIPVLFAGDDLLTPIEQFVSTIGASAYWKSIHAEYGVGPATAGAPIVLDEKLPATMSNAEVETWLAAHVQPADAGADAGFPAPKEVVYAIFPPKGTSLTFYGSASCTAFTSWHSQVALSGGQNVAYAIVPRCDAPAGLTPIDAVTVPMSNALSRAVTDPFGNTAPGYLFADDHHYEYSSYELGAYCRSLPSILPTDFPFRVRRAWSNAAAAQLHQPCFPVPAGSIYFNAAPVEVDTVAIVDPDPVAYGDAQVPAHHATGHGTHIPVGSSKTIDVQLFSEADTGGAWALNVYETGDMTGTGATGALSFKWDRATGSNGDVRKLTITVNKTNTMGWSGYVIVSSKGNETYYWPGLVGF